MGLTGLSPTIEPQQLWAQYIKACKSICRLILRKLLRILTERDNQEFAIEGRDSLKEAWDTARALG